MAGSPRIAGAAELRGCRAAEEDSMPMRGTPKPQSQPNESGTGSGPCKDGFASGRGILLWTENGKPDVEFDGEYANGKRNGHGVLITPDGNRIEGEWGDSR